MITDKIVKQSQQARPPAWFEIFNQAFEMALIVDGAGNISFAPASAAELLGRRVEDLKGAPLQDIVHDRDRAAVVRALERLEEGRSITLDRVRLLRLHDDEPLRLKMWIIPLSDDLIPDGARVVAARDVSAEIKAEEELAQLKRRLEEASQVKATFLSKVTHELKTPLNAILGFAQIISMGTIGPINEQQKEYLGHIVESSTHLVVLINNILDMSKIEAGRGELDVSEFSLPDLIHQAAAMFSDQSLRHRIALETEIEDDITLIQADRLKIKQILFNLLANAFKFTPDGGRVGLKAAVKEDRIQMTVWDTGIGLPDDERDKIFTSFHQIQSNREMAGTGLGLSLSKEFVGLHGGRIWAESDGPNQGSRFHFTLPLRSMSAAQALIDRELEEARRQGRVLSLIMLRVNDFPQLNQVYSTSEIKNLVKEIETRLRQEIREQMDRLLAFEGLGIWAVLTPQQEEAAKRTGQRMLNVLTGEPFYKGLKLSALLEVIPGYGHEEEAEAKPACVLVVDDDPMMREVLMGAIRTAGHQVETAASGKEALKLLLSRPFDLLITDLVMPDFSGSDLIREVHRQGLDMPIIAVTGFEAGLEEVSELKVNQVLKKPFSFRTLWETMDDLLGQRRGA